MKLHGIDFGSVFVASGMLNFFGEGWRHHKFFKMLPGFNFEGATFVSKTTTLESRKGNMELDANLQPVSLFPDCVRVYPLKKVVLNAVGLSGPGAEYLFAQSRWQKRIQPFLISFMAVAATKEERVEEAKKFAEILRKELPKFSAKVGVELNISCPNTSHNPAVLVGEAIDQLRVFVDINLHIPVVLKVNTLTPINAMVLIVDSGMCDAITVSNTIPWGQLPERIDWWGIFGSSESPLKQYGGGGLSGYPLLSIVAEWISEIRSEGAKIPIIGGGGVLKKSDVNLLWQSGASAIMIGSVSNLRPWRIRGIIKRAQQLYGGDQ